MQFTKAFALLALPLMAAASAIKERAPPSSSPGKPSVSCDSGNVQCCDTLTNSSNPQGADSNIPGLLGLIAQLALNVPIGIQCSPIPIIGIATGGCKSQPACCTGNTFNGLVTVGCTPIAAL